MFVRPTSSSSSSDFAGWTYVGSANLSASAWGRLTQDRSSKTMKLTCSNWECGVLVPVRKAAKIAKSSSSHEVAGKSVDSEIASSDNLDMFNGIVPVPMKYPGELYGDKKPWFFM